MDHNPGFDTLAVRAGQQRTNEGEQGEPIFTTSSYVFQSAEEAAAVFSGKKTGNIYSRFTNPTVHTFEKRLAALEGGERCIATASGMAAILSCCMALLNAGEHIVSSRAIFGSISVLFNDHLGRFGITTSYVDPTNLEAWRRAIRPNTRLLFVETPSNPTAEIADISALAALAHAHDCLLVVDNCFCTPALQLPLAMGADIVIHSATKYIDGQGRAIGGAVVGREEQMEKVYGFLRTAGPSMSPFNAWIFLKGLETLRLRMEAHSANALKLAHWLEQQPQVERVYYPGLSSHARHELAKRQQRAFGGVLAFELRGGKEAAGPTPWGLLYSIRPISFPAISLLSPSGRRASGTPSASVSC